MDEIIAKIKKDLRYKMVTPEVDLMARIIS